MLYDTDGQKRSKAGKLEWGERKGKEREGMSDSEEGEGKQQKGDGVIWQLTGGKTGREREGKLL